MQRGFTLIEVLIAVAIVAILAAIALPSYQRYVTRTSREAAESMLMELANAQERIYLNSTPPSYSNSVTGAYTGTSAGGLGITSGKTNDGKYTLAISNFTAHTFTITATPVAGTTQVNDGTLTVDQTGKHGGTYSGTW